MGISQQLRSFLQNFIFALHIPNSMFLMATEVAGLHIYILIQMNGNYFSAHQDNYEHISTHQSIEAQSEFSIDLKPHDIDPLLTKIFMLCIELDRKDILIEQMEKGARAGELKKSQIDISHRDLSHRYEKLQMEYRSVIQNNAVLKNQNLNLQKNLREMETIKKHSMFNKQLQDKARALQSKLMRTEQQKIELIEKEKSLKRQISMLSYNLAKTSEKNKIRDLEHDLAQQRSKLETQKKLTMEQKSFIQKYSSDIRELQSKLVRQEKQFEEKINFIRQKEDLRSSKISMEGEEKVALMAQEMNRLKEEIDHLRRQIYDQKSKVNERDQEIYRLNEQLKNMEKQIQSVNKNIQSMEAEFQKRQEHLLIQLQKFEEENKNLHNTCSDLQFYLKQKSAEDGDKGKTIQRMREQIEQLEQQKLAMKTQIRKVKRQSLKSSGECEVCKVRASTTSISSNKRISDLMNPLDFEQLIRETQKLNQSNKKIQNMINSHEASSHHSIQQRQSLTRVESTQILEMPRT